MESSRIYRNSFVYRKTQLLTRADGHNLPARNRQVEYLWPVPTGVDYSTNRPALLMEKVTCLMVLAELLHHFLGSQALALPTNAFFSNMSPQLTSSCVARTNI